MNRFLSFPNQILHSGRKNTILNSYVSHLWPCKILMQVNTCCVDRNSGEVACHPKSAWKSVEVSISGSIFKVMGYQQPSHCLIHGCSLNTNPAKICKANYNSCCSLDSCPWSDAFCCQELLPGPSCGVQHCLHIPMPLGLWAVTSIMCYRWLCLIALSTPQLTYPVPVHLGQTLA